MAPAIELREATAGDIAAIQAIYAHHVRHGLASFEETPPEADEMERRWREVRARGLPYLTAIEGGRLLGYGYCSPYRPRSAYRYAIEDSIYLDPQAAGRGLGRRLLAALIEDCTRQGYRQMIAVIGDSGNDASIGLHRALGFVPVGSFRSIGFKFGRWVDSVLMQRALGAGDSRLPDR